MRSSNGAAAAVESRFVPWTSYVYLLFFFRSAVNTIKISYTIKGRKVSQQANWLTSTFEFVPACGQDERKMVDHDLERKPRVVTHRESPRSRRHRPHQFNSV